MCTHTSALFGFPLNSQSVNDVYINLFHGSRIEMKRKENTVLMNDNPLRFRSI